MTTKSEVMTIVAAGLAAAAAFVGVGYYAGRDTASSENERLKQEIELYKAAQNTKNVLFFLEDLRKYNENLFEFEKHAQEITNLNGEIARLSEENVRFSAVNSTQSSEIDALNEAIKINKSEVKKLTEKLALKYTVGKEVSILEGQSYTFLGGFVTLGVQSLYSSRAVVTIFDRTEFLDVGEGFRFGIERNECSLVLVGVTKNSDREQGSFSLVCQQKE